MNAFNNSAKDTIAQLNTARSLALSDATAYPRIVKGILSIVGPTAAIELRRWGSDFLAETFATPNLGEVQKQELALDVINTLKDFLELPAEDEKVIKSVVIAATSVYPLVFKYSIYNPHNNTAWPLMAAIKSNILKRMDSASASVRVCCIKFITRVVQVQTPGLIADTRRPEQNELSLALVPREHPHLSPSILEAEAFGLLDRLLNVFQEAKSDALMVSATLNSIGLLVRMRASIANRILNAILNFNPFNIGNATLTPRLKVAIKSMERTTRAFLLNLNKRNPNHSLAGRVQVYLERLQHSRAELFEGVSRKRAAPTEPTDGLDSAKRQRLGADIPTDNQNTMTALIPPLPSGPVSVAQLFTLTRHETSSSFDVQGIPIELVNRIIVPILHSVDQSQLDNAVNMVRKRFLSLSQSRPGSAADAARSALGLEQDSNLERPADTAQIENRLEIVPEDLGADEGPDVTMGPFILPQPPPLSQNEMQDYGNGTVLRVFGMVNSLEDPSATKASKSGFNRLAASNYDRDSWVTVVTRLATRPLAGLGEAERPIKKEETSDDQRLGRQEFSMSNIIRESLYLYVLDDFRRRMDVAISWLNEEWYNDVVQRRAGIDRTEHYHVLALKLLDGIVPYLDAKDKVLIRFLSEIPSITPELLERIKKLAQDPDRVSLAVNSIHYLILYRPPVREICLDAIEDLWRNYDDARPFAANVLKKWRPELLQAQKPAPESNSTPPLPATNAVAA